MEMEQLKELYEKLTSIVQKHDRWLELANQNKEEVDRVIQFALDTFKPILADNLRYYQGDEDITSLDRTIEKGKGDLHVVYDDKLLYTVPEASIFDEDHRESIGNGYFYPTGERAVEFASSVDKKIVRCISARLGSIIRDIPPFIDVYTLINEFKFMYRLAEEETRKEIDLRKKELFDSLERRKKAIEQHLEGLGSFAPLAKIQKK
jgi:hypothetical protein